MADQPIRYPFERRCPLGQPSEYASLREAGRAARVTLWDGSTPWILTHYHDVKALLADNEHLTIEATAPGLPYHAEGRKLTVLNESRTLQSMDPPEHTRIRKMFGAMFTRPRLLALRADVERKADALVDAMLATGGTCDLVADYALPLTFGTLCDFMGLPEEDHAMLLAAQIGRSSANIDGSKGAESSLRLERYLADHLTRIRDEAGGGALSAAPDAVRQIYNEQIVPGHIGIDEAAVHLRMLILAGFDTTMNALSLGVLLLLRHRDQWDALVADPAIVPSAIEEILRYTSVAHFQGRRAAKADFEIAGVCIHAGEGVIASVPAANHDPAVFPEPDRFDVRRSFRNHIAFSFGDHQCLGQQLARMEMDVGLRVLLQRAPGLRLSASLEELQFSERDIQVYGVRRLPVSFD